MACTAPSKCCTWRRRPWSSFYLAGKLRPNEEHRSLALVLPRIADRTSSELAGLWHEGSDGAQFDAAIEHLRSRLEAASKGPRELAKPKAGERQRLAGCFGSPPPRDLGGYTKNPLETCRPKVPQNWPFQASSSSYTEMNSFWRIPVLVLRT